MRLSLPGRRSHEGGSLRLGDLGQRHRRPLRIGGVWVDGPAPAQRIPDASDHTVAGSLLGCSERNDGDFNG